MHRRHPRKQVTVHLPRAVACEVDELLEHELVPHASRDDVVRDAVTRRLDEIRANARATLLPRAAADSSFAAESTDGTPRQTRLQTGAPRAGS